MLSRRALPCPRLPTPNLFLGGDLPRLTLALAPDTDKVKIVQFADPDVSKDDIEVKFRNLEAYLGAPAPCRIFLGKMSSVEKPAPYWLVKATADKDEVNMEEFQMELTASTSATLKELHEDTLAAAELRVDVEKESVVKVILPILVNTKNIPVTRQLFVFKAQPAEGVPTPPKEVPKVNQVAQFRKHLLSKGEGTPAGKKRQGGSNK